MREYAKAVKNTFNYMGRTRRREYWVASLINSAILQILFALVFFAATVAGDCLWYSTAGSVGYTTTGSVIATIFMIPYSLYNMFWFVVSLSLGVRRFHDAGIAAWAYVLCILGTCCCGLGGIALFVISLLNSKEDNQWGPNPKLANPDEYKGATSIVVSIVLYVVAMVIFTVAMVSNMFLDPSFMSGIM